MLKKFSHFFEVTFGFHEYFTQVFEPEIEIAELFWELVFGAFLKQPSCESFGYLTRKNLSFAGPYTTPSLSYFSKGLKHFKNRLHYRKHITLHSCQFRDLIDPVAGAVLLILALSVRLRRRCDTGNSRKICRGTFGQR